jgi:tRNA threonylcarbamoyladenosine modification (KEOPS) complex Cgi121 subunit
LSGMVHTAGIKGSDWYVAIGGFRCGPVADVEDLLARSSDESGETPFQLFDADMVAGWKHLYFAAVNAVRAFEGGSSVSRSLAIETLLYASCQDQISQAFDIIGLSAGTERVALFVLAESPEKALRVFMRISGFLGAADDSVLAFDEGKFQGIKKAFGISDPEIEAVGGPREEALARLLVERGALLPLRR